MASSVSAPGTGFTTVALTHPNGDNAEHQIRTTVGSCEATAVVAGGNWVMQTVAFKAAAACAGLHHQRDEFCAPIRGGGSVRYFHRYRCATKRFQQQRSVVLHHYSGGDSATDLRLRPDSDSGRFGHFRSDRQQLCDHAGWRLHGDGQRCGRIGDSPEGPQPDGYCGCGRGLHRRCLGAHSGYSGGGSVVYFDDHDYPVNGFTDAVALTCTVTPAATRGPTCAFNPASVTGGTAHLDADGKYDRCDYGIARTAIARPHLRHAAADWRAGTARNRHHFPQEEGLGIFPGLHPVFNFDHSAGLRRRQFVGRRRRWRWTPGHAGRSLHRDGHGYFRIADPRCDACAYGYRSVN